MYPMKEKDEEIHYCTYMRSPPSCYCLTCRTTELNSLVVSPTIEKPEVLSSEAEQMSLLFMQSQSPLCVEI
jgi:hypothetical protein